MRKLIYKTRGISRVGYMILLKSSVGEYNLTITILIAYFQILGGFPPTAGSWELSGS